MLDLISSNIMELQWGSQRMNALIDIADKEAVYAALDDSRE